ncbi:MAG: TIM44-like domain-containing protein [Candidatus Riflebacteria bacterium]|nr:TIM44-like domain-containing protein [Candidatus Riflebacteria bacterium]
MRMKIPRGPLRPDRTLFGLVLLIALAAVCLSVLPADALARAGGGQSYGGGGSRGGGGSSSGSGGDGELIFFLLRLIIEIAVQCPELAGVLLLIVVAFVLGSCIKDSLAGWLQGAGAGAETTSRRTLGVPYGPPGANRVWQRPGQKGQGAFSPRLTVEQQLERLKEVDPSFSRPLFLDFVGLLYTRVAQARATGDVDPVAPYVTPDLAQQWRMAPCGAGNPGVRLTGVDEVVVGSIAITGVGGFGGQFVQCELTLEASMVEVARRGEAGKGVWVRELLVLRRRDGVLSRPPEGMRSLGCPSCGAPCELKPDGSCTYCDKVVTRGDLQWQVESLRCVVRKTRPSEDELVSGGEEIGTDLPTRVHPGLAAARRSLSGRHPDFDLGEFLCRVRETFVSIQQAWTAADLDRARAFETDSLYSTHRYWIEMYRASGLRNVLDEIRIEKVDLVKIELDAFYESITVRIFASMIDYTVDAGGSVRSGSKSEPRRFSEYWTFIAAIGSCGAPIKLSQTGVCGHCNALVTSGQFGWVLSRIEQDESYSG